MLYIDSNGILSPTTSAAGKSGCPHCISLVFNLIKTETVDDFMLGWLDTYACDNCGFVIQKFSKIK